jgi:AraC-like DNA-binding protein
MAAKKRKAGASTPPTESWRKPLFDDLLRGIRLQSSIYFRTEFQAPWGAAVAQDCSVFHIIEHGACWLQLNGRAPPIRLSEGDFVVVTRGQPHTVRDKLGTPTVDFFDLVKARGSGNNGVLRGGGRGVLTKIVCGGMVFENRDSNPLLAILPPVLHVKRTEERARRLGLTTAHVRSELDSGEPGSNEVVTRLADILFIQAVRAYFEENSETANSGWLAAVRDEQIGQALAILHSHPHRPWTVTSLARRLAMSRSNFAARFRELVGEPPQRYFKRLRIHLAAEQLRTSRGKLSAIAAAAGFESVAAFTRAFKKQTGHTPGEYRKFGDRSLRRSEAVTAE